MQHKETRTIKYPEDIGTVAENVAVDTHDTMCVYWQQSGRLPEVGQDLKGLVCGDLVYTSNRGNAEK